MVTPRGAQPDPGSDPGKSVDLTVDLVSVLDRSSALVAPQTPVGEVLRIMAGQHQDQAELFCPNPTDRDGSPREQAYVVIGSKRQVWGVVTGSDLIVWIAAQEIQDSPSALFTSSIQRLLPREPSLFRIGDYQGVWPLLTWMQEQGLRWVPAVDDHECLLGVISMERLQRYLISQGTARGTALPQSTVQSTAQSTIQIPPDPAMQIRVQREQALHQVTQVIRSSLDLGEIFGVSAAEIGRFLNAGVSIVQYLPERHCWRHLVSYDRGKARPEKLSLEIPAQANPLSDRLRQLQMVRINRTDQIVDPINQELAQSYPGTWLLIPISIQGTLWGSLSLSRSDPQNPWQDEDVDLAQRVADQLGIGIQQAQTYQQLQQELSERKKVEAELRASQEFFRLAAAAVNGIIYDTDTETWTTQRLGLFDTLGYAAEEIEAQTRWWIDLIHPEDLERISRAIQHTSSEANAHFRFLEYRVRHRQGHYIHLLDYAVILRNERGRATRIVGHSFDITERKQLELKLKQQLEQSQLITHITQQLRCSLHLDQILSTAVDQARELLEVDRVVIYRFLPNYSGEVIAESVELGCLSLINQVITDPCFKGDLIQAYRQGRITMIEDVDQAELQICYRELLQDLQVRANLVVPILVEQDLWGLLIAHHCRGPQPWSDWAPEVMEQLASQLGIAIQQSTLYAQLQSSNQELSYQVNVRNSQLRKALELEALLRLIIEEVRESLDEKQILKTTVRELTHGLDLTSCRVDFPDKTGRSFRAIQCYPVGCPICPASEECLDPETLVSLERGRSVLRTQTDFPQGAQTILSCGIREGEELIGVLDLIRPPQQDFSEPEIRLAEQVASQCAIGIRQARLYQASQEQIQQLTELNQMKEEFVHMVSHELRTPLTNMKMSLVLLKTVDLPERGNRYLEILKGECEREITLVNELLDLQAIESGRRLPMIKSLIVQPWIHALVESFTDRIQERYQHLQLDLPEVELLLHTDVGLLERVVAELLNNACKYTPPDHQIRLSLQSTQVRDRQGLGIEVENTGVMIPVEALPQVFDKFYRVPQVDQWQQGGTGLGLSLVKKAVHCLRGQIRVRSGERFICFRIEIPDLGEDMARDPRSIGGDPL